MSEQELNESMAEDRTQEYREYYGRVEPVAVGSLEDVKEERDHRLDCARERSRENESDGQARSPEIRVPARQAGSGD